MSFENSEKMSKALLESMEEFETFRKYLFGLADDIRKDDRLALIISYAAIEMVLDFSIKQLCKHGSKILEQRISFMGKAMLLSEKGIIDDGLFNRLKTLKDLRNTAAHNPAQNIEWQGKLCFDKTDELYKDFVKVYGYEPDDLIDSLFCLFYEFYYTTIRGHTRKILDEHKAPNAGDLQKE